VRYFELIRFLGISYYTNSNYDFLNAPEFDEISKKIFLKINFYFSHILDSIVKNVIRNWYGDLISILMNSFSSFIDQTNLINVSTYIVLIVSILIIYFLVWKSFEENLRELLKTSVDLINLIPESIKYIIVQRINEDEDNKKE
jgi:Ca2+-dependent lipid-binding protein